MSVLAVIDRELRASARRPITWRLRVVIPGFAFLFSAFGLWVVTLFGGPPIPGADLYEALSWISFAFSMFIGASITADSVSEEKREGTLGLLFLTPLRGHHIALGKFLSAGMTALYSLMAVFWARRQLLRKFRIAAKDRYSLYQRGWFSRLLLGRPNPGNL